MSQFEHVSVAVALIYALVVGRLLAGAAPSLAASRRYPVHAAWIVQIFLVCVVQWWRLWRATDVDWTAFRFLWILGAPSLQYLRAAILLGNPESIESYRSHFYSVRTAYFGTGVLVAVHSGLAPWVLGIVPWFTLAPVHPGMGILATMSVAGLVFKSPAVHTVIVIAAVMLASALLFAMPPLPSAAP